MSKNSDFLNKNFNYLEYHVCDHCNLNCRGCFHYSPLISDPIFRSVKDFIKDCQQIKNILPVNHNLFLSLLGGEPLLHPDLIEFIKQSQQLIPVTSIVTNGILLKTQSQEFFDVINKYNVRIKWSKYYDDTVILNILKEKVNNFIIIDTPKMFLKNFNFKSKYNENIIKYIYNICGDREHNWNCYTLRDGYLYKCAWEAWSDYLINYFDLKIPNYSRDNNRLNIYKAKSIDDINKFINTPSEFCNFCVDGFLYGLPAMNWGISKCKLKEWVNKI